jgi:hypothetical protein
MKTLSVNGVLMKLQAITNLLYSHMPDLKCDQKCNQIIDITSLLKVLNCLIYAIIGSTSTIIYPLPIHHNIINVTR